MIYDYSDTTHDKLLQARGAGAAGAATYTGAMHYEHLTAGTWHPAAPVAVTSVVLFGLGNLTGTAILWGIP